MTTISAAAPGAPRNTDLKDALLALRPHYKRAIFFSVFTTLISLAPTIYMLEVYDRVVNSRSMMTLAMETIAIVLLLAVLEVIEWVRHDVLHNAALEFDHRIGQRTFNAMFEASLRRFSGASAQALNDLRALRGFIGSPALLAIIDVPLALVYLVAVFVVSVPMGWFAVVGGVVQVTLAWLNERSTQPPLMAANRTAIEAQNYAAATLRNAQVIEAMGMQRNIHQRWQKKQEAFLEYQATASDKAGDFSVSARFVQQLLSSLLLGFGAWLMLRGEFPGGGGMMIVGSIFGGKALAPLVQLIAHWKPWSVRVKPTNGSIAC